MADAVGNMAESEVAYIDVDYAVISTENVMYSDSTEPFDQNREITLNRSNRETWKKTLETQQRAATRHWRIVHTAECVAGSSTVLGFGLLITFALRNL